MVTIDDIYQARVEADLESLFDFSVRRGERTHDWIALKPSQSYSIVAGNSTGGVFLTYGAEVFEESLPILYASSEGQAGRVAENLTQWLAILLALPYWENLVKFSGGGEVDEMRRTATSIEANDTASLVNLRKTAERIRMVLSVPDLNDPIETLHGNVHASDCTLVADDGWEYESLFGKFISPGGGIAKGR